uniref:Uncharacterized protein n=1 Tax=Romanomermis culicivorax TaxID=13658 RepID=A0A915HW39_ROMCU
MKDKSVVDKRIEDMVHADIGCSNCNCVQAGFGKTAAAEPMTDVLHDQMEVGISAQAKPEIHDDKKFTETVVDVEACALQNFAINSDAEQLIDHSDDEEMLLDDAKKDI